ncbi:MAG: Dam family site-specific DNA-(adenine-N6)-methyltransferase [Pseudomonadota bacterium]
MNRARPFLKWAGNKYRLLDRILPRLPPGRRLIEPFAGAAAVGLNSPYPALRLVDSNHDLIELYRQIAEYGPEFVDACRALFIPGNNHAETYYALRAEFNASTDPAERARLFVYLNRHGYNGLCRYNRGGGYNVPFGRYQRPYFPEAEMLAFWERARSGALELATNDFEVEFDDARPGDVIYADPPYVPLSATASFTSYGPLRFALEEQTRLADAARRAAARGVPVLISNHDTPFTRDHYHGARLESFDVARSISRDIGNRRPAGELLALFT